MMKKFLLIVGCLFIFTTVFIRQALAQKEMPVVRIAIVKQADDFIVSLRGHYTIVDMATKAVIGSGRALKQQKVMIGKIGIVFGGEELVAKKIRLISSKDITIYHGDKVRRYRGEVDVVVTEQQKLMVINRIDMEAYIRGVLYHEVSAKWPMEAMKAQAVAARTYALYQIKTNKDQMYDVTSDIYSQMYGGKSAERYRTNLAVNRTEGQVLLSDGKILPAFFHANCGGHTEDVSELWKFDLKPLKGVKCPYCRLQPGYAWKRNFKSQDVQELLNQKGYKIGSIKDVAIVGKNRSGRITFLRFEDRDGKVLLIAGKDFRDIVGPNIVRSNKYNVEMKGYYFDLIGVGWGHGVGMCQWGANQMSQEGFTYEQILEFYYPGAKLVKVE